MGGASCFRIFPPGAAVPCAAVPCRPRSPSSPSPRPRCCRPASGPRSRSRRKFARSARRPSPRGEAAACSPSPARCRRRAKSTSRSGSTADFWNGRSASATSCGRASSSRGSTRRTRRAASVRAGAADRSAGPARRGAEQLHAELRRATWWSRTRCRVRRSTRPRLSLNRAGAGRIGAIPGHARRQPAGLHPPGVQRGRGGHGAGRGAGGGGRRRAHDRTGRREGARDAVHVPARGAKDAVTANPDIVVALTADPEVTAKGVVREVAPRADPVTGTFRSRIRHPPAAMRPPHGLRTHASRPLPTAHRDPAVRDHPLRPAGLRVGGRSETETGDRVPSVRPDADRGLVRPRPGDVVVTAGVHGRRVRPEGRPPRLKQ